MDWRGAEYRASPKNGSPLCGRQVGQLLWCARSDTPAWTQAHTVVHTETITTTKSQCRVSRCDQWTAPHCCSLGRSWTFDSVAIHLLVVTQKQRAARTASVTNNTCLHTSSLLGSRAPRHAEIWQHNSCRQVHSYARYNEMGQT